MPPGSLYSGGMRVIVAMLIASAGCASTHRSVMPPYVQELKPAPGGLQMVQCGMVFSKTTTYGLAWLFFDLGPGEETELEQGQCWTTYVPAEVRR